VPLFIRRLRDLEEFLKSHRDWYFQQRIGLQGRPWWCLCSPSSDDEYISVDGRTVRAAQRKLLGDAGF
jgi:hypothetical protein